MACNGDHRLDRRDLLTRAVPACAMAWLGVCKLPWMGVSDLAATQQDQHKFDVPRELTMSVRRQIQGEYRQFIGLIEALRAELGEPELIRLLNLYSADNGRRVGETQAQAATDTSFRAFVNQFRPPRYATTLTHEVVEDTEKAFELRVTECVWAEVFQAAGLGGEIGHAAVCNMDYYWPPAFNPNLKMERTRTLMQGHDHCNHRYVDTG
ncbi:MAG: L-2-amino-thiazoline-4-carboxylic acid hydrolase [Gemmatimonadota bacterium]|nr:MAG: L-2-amino-thiazoline-4-carboxylic acid hydrolase [Gemmatimonadota bacterium]